VCGYADYKYIVPVRSDRVCRTWRMFVNVRLKSMSSASPNSSVIGGSSLSQKPIRLHRLMNIFSLARSAAVHMMPDRAGAPYVNLATTVARNTSCSAVTGMPWLRRTRKAYNRLEQDDTRLFTCSVAVRRSLTTMPSILKRVTLSMLRHWEGS